MTVFTNKLVAIVNKDIETGIAMNALAHASIAMGAKIGVEALRLENYEDAGHNIWPISAMPYIILRGKSGEIRKTVLEARSQNILDITFLDTMTGGSYVEQMA